MWNVQTFNISWLSGGAEANVGHTWSATAVTFNKQTKKLPCVCRLLQRVHTNGPNHSHTVSQFHITVFTKRLLDFSTDIIPNPSDGVQTQKTLPLYPSWHCVSFARVLPWLPGRERLVKITLMASLCQSSSGASECFHRRYGDPQGKWSSRVNSAECPL